MLVVRSLAVCLVAGITSTAFGIETETLQSNPQGLNADVLAAKIVDTTTPELTLNLGAITQYLRGDIDIPALEDCAPAAIGTFSDGIPIAGKELPEDNQVDPQNPVTYEGGIGLQSGVCLCTGYIQEDDLDGDDLAEFSAGAVAGQHIGVAGPNDGFFLMPVLNTAEGEASKDFIKFFDLEFADSVPSDSTLSQPDQDELRDNIIIGGDAAVLQFDILVTTPGFLKVTFVFASDELPNWEQEFNDTAAILVDGQNILTFRTFDSAQQKVETEPLTLQKLQDCNNLFLKNDVAPAPSVFDNSAHNFGAGEWYDHEFSGFSIPLIRITGDDPTTEEKEVIPLSPGLHTIKLIVHDVGDPIVDAAIFFEEDSMQFLPVLPADFNLDGKVDSGDLNILAQNGGSNKTFREGDADFDGDVDDDDLTILNDNWLATGGFAHFRADFNRDGVVSVTDYLIWLDFKFTTPECASRFEGDANDDGSVDGSDFNIWFDEWVAGGMQP